MGWTLGIIGFFAFCGYLIFRGTQSSSPETIDYEKIVNEVSAKSQRSKNSIIDQLVPLMKSEFPDFDQEFSIVSLDKFYDFSRNWVSAYHPREYAEDARKRTLDNPEFLDEMKLKLPELLPPRFAIFAQENFDEWLAKMDALMKVSVQRGWIPLDMD